MDGLAPSQQHRHYVIVMAALSCRDACRKAEAAEGGRVQDRALIGIGDLQQQIHSLEKQAGSLPRCTLWEILCDRGLTGGEGRVVSNIAVPSSPGDVAQKFEQRFALH